MWRRAILILFFLFANADLVRAVQPDEVLNDAALETRARNLSRELRCMVCKISRPMIQSAATCGCSFASASPKATAISRCLIFSFRVMGRSSC